jgi:glycosyltransferase involved in cell wall biosynthesis
MARKKILWLCSWYPGKTEPFNGDFIQRQAQAAALYNDIYVIHIYGDASGTIKRVEKEINHHDHLTEHIIYYPKSRGRFGRIRAGYRWLNLFRHAIRHYISTQGQPDLVHVQVPMKAGLFGTWIKRKYEIPYLVTEHWGIYNPVAPDSYEKKGPAFKKYTERIFSRASRAISPSAFLAQGVNQMVVKKEWTIIPNVVNTGFFNFPGIIARKLFRFIHVSNMVPLKNPEGILRAFQGLMREFENVELVMVGDKDPSIRLLAKELNLGEKVFSRGEIPYPEVAREMKLAHCLLLYSDIENSPCVIGESLCCGVPVIASRVGGIPELIDNSNGFLIAPGDPELLQGAMKKMILEYENFDRQRISREAAARFSYPVIGQQLDELYRLSY